MKIHSGKSVNPMIAIGKAGTGIETRPFFDGKYLAVGAALCGGRAYATL